VRKVDVKKPLHVVDLGVRQSIKVHNGNSLCTKEGGFERGSDRNKLSTWGKEGCQNGIGRSNLWGMPWNLLRQRTDQHSRVQILVSVSLTGVSQLSR
jgi:hypothetical protein